MTRTKSQKARAAAARTMPQKGKRFLDGLNVGISMPGSTNRVTSGNAKGGALQVANRKTRSAPAAVTSAKPTRAAQLVASNDSAVVSGADFLGFVNVNGHVSGDVRFSKAINPFMLPSSRVASAAAIYEKWRIRRMTFSYVTSVPTSQAGQLIQYVDYDVTNTLVSSAPSNVSVASAHTKNTPFSVWNNASLDYGRNCPWLFTSNNGVDDRLDSAGLFTVVCVSNFSGTVSLGALYVDYEIEFAQGQSMSPSSGLTTMSSYGVSTGGSYAQPLGVPIWAKNSFGLVVGPNPAATSSRCTFPSQTGSEQYHVIARFTCAAAITGAPTPAVGTSPGSFVTAAPGQCLSAATAGVPGTSGSGGNWSSLTWEITFTPTVPGPAWFDISFAGATGGAGATNTYFFVHPLGGVAVSRSLKDRVVELEKRLAAVGLVEAPAPIVPGLPAPGGERTPDCVNSFTPSSEPGDITNHPVQPGSDPWCMCCGRTKS